MTMRTSTLVALVLCSVIGACAPAPGATQAGSAPGARNNVLTQAQLSATNSMNLYDAISKLHPDWLSSRGPTSVTDATATSVSIFMGGTMLVQQWLTPQQGDPTQRQMMMIMPIFFTFMFFNFPAGLVLYWLVSNLLSISQQYWSLRAAT